MCFRSLMLGSVVAITLIGCTNSKLVIAPLYNRLDDQMRGEFHKLAKFNQSQIEHFENRVGTFHVWHRQSELPQYAELLNTIQASIKTRNNTTREEVRGWIDSAEMFTQRARICHPVNFSYDLMQTLTDKQVNFIERRFASERKKNFDRYLSRTPEERVERRVNNVVKWAKRIGFDFTKTQKTMLETTMTEQVSLRRQYYRLVEQWAASLFIIARDQSAEDYENRMQAKVSELWTLLEKAHTDEWTQNRELWRNFAFKFVQSLTYDQRIFASNWLSKMSKTLNGIAADKPSFENVGNPEYGCLIDQPVNG